MEKEVSSNTNVSVTELTKIKESIRESIRESIKRRLEKKKYEEHILRIVEELRRNIRSN